jgi:hypothetical protein
LAGGKAGIPAEEGIAGNRDEETDGNVGEVGNVGKEGVDNVAGNSGKVGLGPNVDKDGGAAIVPKDNF